MVELIPLLMAAFFTVAAVFLFGGFRIQFVFAEETLRKALKINLPFCRIAWAAFAVDSVLLLIGSAFEMQYPDKSFGGFGGFFWVLFLFALLAVAASAYFLIDGGVGTVRQYLRAGLRTFPYFAFFYTLLLFGFILPFVPFAVRFVMVFLACAAAGLYVAVRLFGAGPLRFLTRPAVFMGEKEYTVVFSTSVPTVACLEYMHDGQHYVLWDSENRIKNVGRIHSVRVPHAHLENNSYTVRARRSVEALPYGGMLGKKEIRFTVDEFSSLCEYEVKLLALSDWHGSRLRWTSLPSSCSALLLMGDMDESIDCEYDFIYNLLSPCSEILHGRRPAVFVRGNHDLRGFRLNELYRRFGIEQFNYRFSLGEVHFTVIDGGEDKADEHFEYAGYLDNFRSNEQTLEWLERQPMQHGMCIALTHMPTIFPDATHREKAWETLHSKGIRLLIAGHTHKTEYIPAAEARFVPINTFVTGAAAGEQPTYSVVTISGSMVELKTFDFSTHKELFSKELILYTD